MALNTLFGQNEEKQVISSPTIFFDDKMINNMVEGDSGISSLDEGLTLNVKIQVLTLPGIRLLCFLSVS